MDWRNTLKIAQQLLKYFENFIIYEKCLYKHLVNILSI